MSDLIYHALHFCFVSYKIPCYLWYKKDIERYSIVFVLSTSYIDFSSAVSKVNVFFCMLCIKSFVPISPCFFERHIAGKRTSPIPVITLPAFFYGQFMVNYNGSCFSSITL